MLPTLYVHVTMGTAMGSREYTGTPRDSGRSVSGLRSARMASAARGAEAYKQIKHGWRVQQAGGGAIFEGACAKDYGGFGAGGRQVLRFVAKAHFDEPPAAVKALFMWRGAPHITVYAASAVVMAHDSNHLHAKHRIGLARPVHNAGERGLPERRLAAPRLGLPLASSIGWAPSPLAPP
jgi:hypothetical protein